MKLVKVFLLLGILVLVGMQYWSSLIVENELQGLKREVETLRVMGRAQGQVVQPTVHAHADLERENLLQEDPFYTKTLPGLLGPNFQPAGVMRSAEMGRPQNLHPFANWAPVSAAWSLCSVTVAKSKFGTYETLSPNMAIRMEKRGDEFWVFLRDHVYWQPLKKSFFPDGFELSEHFLQPHKVTAHDFKFYYDVVMNPFVQESGASALRNYLGDIEEFRVIDDQTFVVRWRNEGGRVKYIAKAWTGALRPLPRFVFQYLPDGEKIVDEEDYRTNSVWAQNFSHHWAKNVIVSCGPWVFDGWDRKKMSFVRNDSFYDPYAALVERREVEFKESPDAIWQDFKAGKIDTFESRYAPEKLIELEDFEKSGIYRAQLAGGQAIKELPFVDRSFRYIGWNQANPLFSSKKVRQAMTMAIDRRRIITTALNDQGIETTGPLFPNDPAYNPELVAWPFDPSEARRLLAELGWKDTDGDGVLDKMIEGKKVKFSFSLLYYVKSTTGRITAEYIKTALGDIGVECKPLGVDTADLSAAFEGKDFDALYLAWGLGSPPAEPKQLWHSSGAKEKGSSNMIGFANSEVDAIIGELQYEYDQEKRNTLYHRFHEIIHDEAPYTFLYVPKLTLLYREYVQNVFIPAQRQDLIPGATVSEPVSSIFWIKPDA